MAGAIPKVLSVDFQAAGGVDEDVLIRGPQVLLTGDLRCATIGIGTDPEIDVVGVCHINMNQYLPQPVYLLDTATYHNPNNGPYIGSISSGRECRPSRIP